MDEANPPITVSSSAEEWNRITKVVIRVNARLNDLTDETKTTVDTTIAEKAESASRDLCKTS